MAEIKFDKIKLNNYFDQNNIQINEQQRTFINSIFNECDVEDEQGQQGNDGVLSRDEVRCFMEKVTSGLGHLAQDFFNFINDIANQEQEPDKIQSIQQNREIKEVECRLSKEEQETYNESLKAAKDICNKNQKQLGLTDEELAFINNSTVKSEVYGAARFDSSSNRLVFNYNSDGDTSIGSLLKVLIHEATHASINSGTNSKSEERQCETRALTKAYELFSQGKISDFEIIKGSDIYISKLDTNEKISQFVEQWLAMGYKDLPEQ